MSIKRKLVVIAVAIVLVGGVYYFTVGRKAARKGEPIKISQEQVQSGPLNPENRSPLSGVECANWKRRPVAVMQPSDVPARPASGFSDADMVFEMPVITASVTRLMAVYVCNDPDDVGSMRSSRHDYLPLAKGLDAIYVHWGGSQYAKDKLNEGVIDNMNCNNDGGKSAAQYCYRKEGMSRGVDSGYAKFAKILEGAKDFGYRMENQFSGYLHQEEASLDQRPSGAHLRVAFAGPFAVEYDYDKESNTFLRTWGDVADTDRNNGKRNAPKNVVVMIAQSTQMIDGEQYNNVQIGDPWYDDSDSGDAYYYMNGQQTKGTWKKDKSKIDSKLFFYDESGQEVKFIPGQIWVEILEPGQNLKWQPAA